MQLPVGQVMQALTGCDPEAYGMLAQEASAASSREDGFKIVDPLDHRRLLTGLAWDSRTVVSGDVFLAIKGERTDGNRYIASALREGAALVIATEPVEEKVKALASEMGAAVVLVDDPYDALARIAACNRSTLSCPVVGITGSTGKTTTKDFVRAVLAERFAVVATEGNRNNEIGVPATVIAADSSTGALVVEMGMRGRGQIEKMCRYVQPRIGVISNIGVTHAELLGSQENIARAKAELLSALPFQKGIAVLNADDPFTPFLEKTAAVDDRGIEVVTFGCAPEADVRAVDVTLDEAGHASFTLVLPDENPACARLSLPGRHNVSNALSAAAVGHVLGIGCEEIVHALSCATGSGMRQEIVEGPAGIRVINDAYNANPDSMRAAIALLSEMPCTGVRIAVLGDMGELGEDEVRLHEVVGAQVAHAGIDLLVTAGPLGHAVAAGARAAGMCGDSVIETETREAAGALLDNTVGAGDLVLVKASRFMEFEHIVEGLVS